MQDVMVAIAVGWKRLLNDQTHKNGGVGELSVRLAGSRTQSNVAGGGSVLTGRTGWPGCIKVPRGVRQHHRSG